MKTPSSKTPSSTRKTKAAKPAAAAAPAARRARPVAAKSAKAEPAAKAEPKARAKAPVELIVQINGRKRGAITVPRDAEEQTVMETIRANAQLAAHLDGQAVRKVVVVQNRLVNLVI